MSNLSDEILNQSLDALDKLADGDDSEVTITRVPLKIPNITASKIKEFRTRHHLTQQRLAIELGVSIRTVQSWEIGRSNPNGSAKRLLQIMFDNPQLLNHLFVHE
ncbi:MAG: helix-turn-helix domain-containing protein [Lentilactobacillus diolivorans]|uniref:helix-turn-helix domain-containing protein n=1 Tax=Lentilactobacillus diolivorans TaxID=179838 RepID=UPI0039E8ED2B